MNSRASCAMVRIGLSVLGMNVGLDTLDVLAHHMSSRLSIASFEGAELSFKPRRPSIHLSISTLS